MQKEKNSQKIEKIERKSIEEDAIEMKKSGNKSDRKKKAQRNQNMEEKKPPKDRKIQSSLSKWVIEKEKRSKNENTDEKTFKIIKEIGQSEENDKNENDVEVKNKEDKNYKKENDAPEDIKVKIKENKKEDNLTPSSKFKFIRKQFEDIGGESVNDVSNIKFGSLNNKLRKGQLTPSVVTKEKQAEKGDLGRPFNGHKPKCMDLESERIKGGSNGKRKFGLFSDFDEDKANFSPGKRVKTKNYPIFQLKSARLGNVPEQGGSKETDGDKRPKKGEIFGEN